MKVKYFAYIRDFTGCRQAEEPDCDSVYSLLHMLSDKYGTEFRNKVLSQDGQALGKDIIILVNGRHVSHLAGIQTPLSSKDEVSVFPVVAGG